MNKEQFSYCFKFGKIAGRPKVFISIFSLKVQIKDQRIKVKKLGLSYLFNMFALRMSQLSVSCVS